MATFGGEVVSQFLVKTITGADTIHGGGHVYVKDGIKKKYTIPFGILNLKDFIKIDKAVPVSKGAWTVDGKSFGSTRFYDLY